MITKFKKYENEEYTVFDVDASEDAITASAFAINENYCITSYHLLKSVSDSILLYGINGSPEPIDAIVAGCDVANDLLVLKIDGEIKIKNIPYFFNNYDRLMGLDVDIVGYPDSDNLHRNVKCTKGSIAGLDIQSYHLNAELLGGYSGGPVISSKKDLQVLGIVSTAYKNATCYAFAIKSVHIINLCKKLNIPINNNMKNENFDVINIKKMKNYVYYVRIPNPIVDVEILKPDELFF